MKLSIGSLCLLLVWGLAPSLSATPAGGPVMQVAASELELNGREKWQVDPAMMVHLRAIEVELGSHEGKTVADYHKLASRLQKSLGLLVASCSMKGKAHDQLHKWLVPFMQEVGALSQASEVPTLEKVHRSLQERFVVFNCYFR